MMKLHNYFIQQGATQITKSYFINELTLFKTTLGWRYLSKVLPLTEHYCA